MADDVVIRISAQNLTRAEFDAARKSLDDLGKKAGLTNTSFGQMGKGFQGAASQLASFNPTAARATSLLGGFGPIGVAAGVGIGAMSAAIGFGTKNLIEMGDRLTRLSRTTTIATDDLQRMEAFGRPLGITLEQMASSSNKLDKALGGGGAGVTRALKILNLSLDELSAMTADERLRTVQIALSNLNNPLDQAAAGAALLGKSWAEMRLDAASIEEGNRALNGLVVVSKEALDAGDALGDSWGALWHNMKATAAEDSKEIVKSINSIVEALDDFLGKWREAAEEQDKTVSILNEANRRVRESFESGGSLSFAEAKKQAEENFRITTFVAETQRKADEKRLADLKKIQAGNRALTDEEQREIEKLEKLREKAAEKELKHIEEVKKRMEHLIDVENLAKDIESALSLSPHFIEITPIIRPPTDTAGLGAGALFRSGGGGFHPSSGTSTAPFVSTEQVQAGMAATAESADDAFESLGDLSSELANLAHLSDILGPKLASVFQGLSTGLSGLGSIRGGLSTLDSTTGILGTISGIGGIASGIGAIAAPIIALLKGLGGPDIGRDVGRDIGANISEELEAAIEESGENAQMFLREIFEEGGLGIDRFAEEVGDLFSMFERGEISEESLIGELEETLPILIEHFQELGPEGQEQLDRIIQAARDAGIEIEELGALISLTLDDDEVLAIVDQLGVTQEAADALGLTFEQLQEKLESVFAPETLETLAENFGKTTEEMRAILAELGIEAQTNLEAAAAGVGLTVDEFRALQDSVEEVLGREFENIEEFMAFLEQTGADVAALAEQLGLPPPGAPEGAAPPVEGQPFDPQQFGDSAGNAIGNRLDPHFKGLSMDIGSMRADMSRLPDVIARAIRDAVAAGA